MESFSVRCSREFRHTLRGDPGMSAGGSDMSLSARVSAPPCAGDVRYLFSEGPLDHVALDWHEGALRTRWLSEVPVEAAVEAQRPTAQLRLRGLALQAIRHSLAGWQREEHVA